MPLRKPIFKKPTADEKASTPLDPFLKENARWANEMQSVLSPYWAARSAYPDSGRKDHTEDEAQRAA